MTGTSPLPRQLTVAALVAALGLGCSSESASVPPELDPAAAPPPLEAADGWWREVTFYEIFVRSFADASDGPLADDGIGDLTGLIERLDYLNDGDPDTRDDLGIGAIWLMPVAESPSYHGYDVVDFYRIERDYGTNEEFRRLVAAAHRRGIRVVVDLVLNHTSSRHLWFREAREPDAPLRDWYIWSYERLGYVGPWGQPVWHQLPWWQRGWRHLNYHAYYGIFWSGMPDLNYRNPDVTAAMHEMARFWLQDMGVDGFRLDAVRHLIEDGRVQAGTPETHAWLREFLDFCKQTKPGSLLIGEVWDNTEAVAAYGPDELDLAFQFELAEAMVRATRDADRARLDEVYEKIRRLQPDRDLATFLTNHDQPRVLSQLYDDLGGARAAAGLLLTGPGTPFVYYGEELGMSGNKPDPQIRRPMQWSDARYAGFSTHRPWQQLDPGFERTHVAGQTADAASLLSLYRRLIRLRSARPALRSGAAEPVAATDPRVWALERRRGPERLLTIVNLGEEPVAGYGLEAPGGAWTVPPGARELLHGVELDPPNGALWTPLDTLEPRATYVIELSAPAAP